MRPPPPEKADLVFAGKTGAWAGPQPERGRKGLGAGRHPAHRHPLGDAAASAAVQSGVDLKSDV